MSCSLSTMLAHLFGPALCDLPERVYSSTLRLAGPFQVIGFADLRFGSVIAPVSTSDTDRF
jgi:hypothetical protein